MKEERIAFIDITRILAIFLIILFHVLFEIYENNSLRQIGFVGVSLFFILSGYSLAKKYPKLESFSIKWFLRRYAKIAIFYCLSLTSIVLLFGNQTYIGNPIKHIIIHSLFLDYFFPEIQYSIISPAWFLVPLIGLYLLFPYLNRLIKKHYLAILIPIAITVYMRYSKQTFTDYSPLFFLAEFCFGIALAQENKDIRKTMDSSFSDAQDVKHLDIKNSAILSSILLAFPKWIMFVPYPLFCILSKIKFESNKILYFISTNTFVLFLFHESIIKIVFNKWGITQNPILDIIIVLITAILISLISKKA